MSQQVAASACVLPYGFAWMSDDMPPDPCTVTVPAAHIPVTRGYLVTSSASVSAGPQPMVHADSQSAAAARVDSCRYLVKKLVVELPLSR